MRFPTVDLDFGSSFGAIKDLVILLGTDDAAHHSAKDQ